MKKINMLIAVFAVMAAASVARAGEVIDFDGKKSSVGEYGFTAGNPAGLTINCAGIDYQVSAMPIACGGGLSEWIQAEIVDAPARDAAGVDKTMLGRVYQAQPGIREVLADHFRKNNGGFSALLLAEKNLRVIADDKAVYLVSDKVTVKMDNPELAARVYEVIYPSQKNRKIPANKLLIEAAIVGAIGCMTSDDCWGAIGDGVSGVAEWLNS